ncbi:MAG: hypothetical protein ACE5KF_12800 [Kiloniellaceae bacterium]
MTQAKATPLISKIVVSNGGPRHDRRLADKILAAFNHAYAAGEPGIAGTLRRALEEAERGSGAAAGDRRSSGALAQADLWAAFVDARDAYRRISARARPGPEALEQAETEMLAAYKRWSYS